MTKKLLNVFQVSRADVDWIHSLGFNGARTAARNPDPEIRRREIKQLRRWNTSLVLFKHGDPVEWVDELVAGVTQYKLSIEIELGNEHNLGKWYAEPTKHLDWLYEMGKHIPAGITVYAGSIHALIPDAMAWAEKVIPQMPSEYIPALHPYRTELDQHEGLELLDDWRALRPGRFGITEIGWHTAIQKKPKPWPRCFWNDRWRWTDQDVARIAAEERWFWEDEGADMIVWYQINDGPGSNALDRYGIRDIDGNPKPVSQVWL